MKVNNFSYILILLMFVLVAKASVLFGRIQEQTIYTPDTSSSSVLIESAYADNGNSKKSQVTTEAKMGPAQKKVVSSEVSTNIVEEEEDDEMSNKAATIISEEGAISKTEQDLLKKLSERRRNLEDQKKDLGIKEQVLQETEAKIDHKVEELKALQSQVEGLIKQYNQKEQGKILSLVKIYESMKPREAAKIFNELEMPVLLKVVSNMKEIKVAPIIAAMDPMKARDLSLELAKQKTIEHETVKTDE